MQVFCLSLSVQKSVKYYEETLEMIRLARIIKKAKLFRQEGDYFKACVVEYEARNQFGADLLVLHNNELRHMTCQTAPMSEIEREVRESIHFFHNGFRYHLKNKHEK